MPIYNSQNPYQFRTPDTAYPPTRSDFTSDMQSDLTKTVRLLARSLEHEMRTALNFISTVSRGMDDESFVREMNASFNHCLFGTPFYPNQFGTETSYPFNAADNFNQGPPGYQNQGVQQNTGPQQYHSPGHQGVTYTAPTQPDRSNTPSFEEMVQLASDVISASLKAGKSKEHAENHLHQFFKTKGASNKDIEGAIAFAYSNLVAESNPANTGSQSSQTNTITPANSNSNINSPSFEEMVHLASDVISASLKAGKSKEHAENHLHQFFKTKGASNKDIEGAIAFAYSNLVAESNPANTGSQSSQTNTITPANSNSNISSPSFEGMVNIAREAILESLVDGKSKEDTQKDIKALFKDSGATTNQINDAIDFAYSTLVADENTEITQHQKPVGTDEANPVVNSSSNDEIEARLNALVRNEQNHGSGIRLHDPKPEDTQKRLNNLRRHPIPIPTQIDAKPSSQEKVIFQNMFDIAKDAIKSCQQEKKPLAEIRQHILNIFNTTGKDITEINKVIDSAFEAIKNENPQDDATIKPAAGFQSDDEFMTRLAALNTTGSESEPLIHEEFPKQTTASLASYEALAARFNKLKNSGGNTQPETQSLMSGAIRNSSTSNETPVPEQMDDESNAVKSLQDRFNAIKSNMGSQSEKSLEERLNDLRLSNNEKDIDNSTKPEARSFSSIPKPPPVQNIDSVEERSEISDITPDDSDLVSKSKDDNSSSNSSRLSEHLPGSKDTPSTKSTDGFTSDSFSEWPTDQVIGELEKQLKAEHFLDGPTDESIDELEKQIKADEKRDLKLRRFEIHMKGFRKSTQPKIDAADRKFKRELKTLKSDVKELQQSISKESSHGRLERQNSNLSIQTTKTKETLSKLKGALTDLMANKANIETTLNFLDEELPAKPSKEQSKTLRGLYSEQRQLRKLLDKTDSKITVYSQEFAKERETFIASIEQLAETRKKADSPKIGKKTLTPEQQAKIDHSQKKLAMRKSLKENQHNIQKTEAGLKKTIESESQRLELFGSRYKDEYDGKIQKPTNELKTLKAQRKEMLIEYKNLVNNRA